MRYPHWVQVVMLLWMLAGAIARPGASCTVTFSTHASGVGKAKRAAFDW